MKNKNIVWHPHKVSKEDRVGIKGHKPCILWFTGLSGSGKSTIAHELEYIFNKASIHTYVLDGDNVRHGLNKDLGFSKEDREENIRRISEVSRLFMDAGVLTIAAFISPYKKDRDLIRELLDEDEFIEIYTKCSLDVCVERDVKGLYKKAMDGKINNFTGISDPYEEPINPELVIETDKLSVDESVEKAIAFLKNKGIINI